MKQLSESLEVWLARQAKLKRHRSIQAASLAAHRRRLKKSRGLGPVATVVVEAPGFLLGEDEDHREVLAKCLAQIERVLSRGQSVRIKFTNTERVYPGGTLVFVSTVLRLARKYPSKISLSYPKNATVEELFHHIGFLEKFGLPARIEVSQENVRYWRFIEGDNNGAEKIGDLVSAYMSQLDNNPNADLYGCLSEAILNVSYHAYPPGTELPPGNPPWWMLAEQRNSRLFVAVYDTGIGIPASLRSRPVFAEQFGSALHLNRHRYDHKLIARAVETPRSTTGKANHGKGLPEMLEFARGTPGGRFRVLSDHGEYRFDDRHGGSTSRHMPMHLQGTLLFWSIPLSSPTV